MDVIEDAEQEIEKLEGTPKQEARRLTRSMCHTPVNEKGLPEASGNIRYMYKCAVSSEKLSACSSMILINI